MDEKEEFFFWMLEQEQEDLGEDALREVEIKGAVNVNTRPISNYEVRCAYGDIVFMVCILKDYIRRIRDKEDPMWDWYKEHFAKMADGLAAQIGYDYEAKKKKCEKKMEKMQEATSDIGGEAMELAVRSGTRTGSGKEGKTHDRGKGI